MKSLMLKVGTYEKDGQTKNKWLKLGVLINGDNGEYALLEPNVDLAGVLMQQNMLEGKRRSSIMCSVFDDSNQNSRPNRQVNNQPNQGFNQQQNNQFNDDIDF